MKEKEMELNQLTKSLNEIQNEIGNAHLSSLRLEKAHLQNLLSQQSQISTAQAKVNELQYQLNSVVSAADINTAQLNNLQAREQSLMKQKQINLDILGTLKNVLQNYKEVDGKKLNDSIITLEKTTSSNIEHQEILPSPQEFEISIMGEFNG